MSLRSNKLEFLPDEIGQMTKLRVLNLSDNRYTHARTHTYTHAETKLLYDSVVNRYNAHTSANFFNGRFGSVYCFHGNGWVCCYGYMLCGLYSVWVMKHLCFFFFLTFPLSPPLCVSLSIRLKNLPFTFTKLKDLAALWLSDNQVSLSLCPRSPREHVANKCVLTNVQHKHTTKSTL